MAEESTESTLAVEDVQQDKEDQVTVAKGDIVRTVLRRPRQMGREQFLAVLSASNPRPQDFNSSSANLMQISQSIFDLYLPPDGDQRPLATILTSAPLSPALRSASKAMWALLIHRESGDARLLLSANNMYQRTLRHSRQELIHAETDPMRVAGTAYLLLVCELLQRVSLDDRETVRPHGVWFISFMERYRADTNNVAMKLVHDSKARLSAVWELLITRRLPIGVNRLPHETELTTGTVTALSDLTILTSSVLEVSDNLCQSQCEVSLPFVLNTLERNVSVQGALHAWMASYLKQFDLPPYWLIEAASLPCKTGRGTRLLFRRVYDFVDLECQMLYIGYWSCQLVLVNAYTDLMKRYENILETDEAESMRLKSLADEYASYLAKSMPSMGKPYCGWTSCILAVRPLHLLLLHYRRRGEWQKLSWCVECAKDLGIFLDPIQRPVAGSQANQADAPATRT